MEFVIFKNEAQIDTFLKNSDNLPMKLRIKELHLVDKSLWCETDFDMNNQIVNMETDFVHIGKNPDGTRMRKNIKKTIRLYHYELFFDYGEKKIYLRKWGRFGRKKLIKLFHVHTFFTPILRTDMKYGITKMFYNDVNKKIFLTIG